MLESRPDRRIELAAMNGSLALGAVLAASLTSAAAAACEPADAEAVDAAKGLHRAAEVHFDRGRYALAIDAWERAHALDCEAHRLLVNIGNARARAGEREEAIAAYERFLADAGDDEMAPAVRAKLAEVRASEPGPSPDAAPFVAAGIGGALAVAGLVMVGVGAETEPPAGLHLQEVGGGLAVAGLGTAAGALLWMLLAEEPAPRWSPSVGLGSAGVAVRF